MISPEYCQAVLTFHPNQANPARPSGRGVWRVYWSGYVDRNHSLKPIRTMAHMSGGKELVIPARRVYKKGSRLDPAKAVRYVAQV